jgi:HSCB C-terminal oligomerisation domain
MELENAIGYEDWEEAKKAVIRLRYWESFQRAATGQKVDH